MPHGSVCVASSGYDATEASLSRSPVGSRRSKAAATLRYALADAEYWLSEFESNVGSGPDDIHVLLADPSVAELDSALDQVREHLASRWQPNAIWGAQFGFAFSGHGSPDGTILLSDGSFDVCSILPTIVPDLRPTDSSRLMGRLFLDSCYAGAALCQSLASLPPSVSLRDAYAAALHDEQAWESDELEHGFMSYIAGHASPIDAQAELLQALVDAGAWKVDSSGRLAPVPSFVYSGGLTEQVRRNMMDFDLMPYLSEGDQHVLDVMNTRVVTVRGRGRFDIMEEFGDNAFDACDLYRIIEDLTRLPLDLGVRISPR